MQYDERKSKDEQEMSDLLGGQEVQNTVTINGRQVIKKKKAKVNKHLNQKAAEEDPLSQLGFGIVAYVGMLYRMTWMFVLFSILLLPTIHAFKSGDAYEGDQFVGKAVYMISNMGYSSVECRNIPVSLGSIGVTCPFGRVGKIFDYGINNPDLPGPIDACQTNDYNSPCKPTSQRIGQLFSQTIGKERASVTFTQGDIYAAGTQPGSQCTEPTNLLFVQYTCEQNNEEQSAKFNHLVVATATASLISLLFVINLSSLYKGGKI